MDDTICDKCGMNLTSLHEVFGVPPWPFCPHGPTKQGSAERSSYVQDQIPGGLVLNNYGPEPITVHSHSEARAIAASRGLTYLEKFSPMPGTDIDPAGIPNPAGYMDPVTLANGAELILRGSKAVDEDKAFAERAYRPQPDQVLSESEARVAHQAIHEREVERGKSR